ncbi:MAG TPA: hypothetical protein VGF76_21290, partial [Polyangiaceae bacterium]
MNESLLLPVRDLDRINDLQGRAAESAAGIQMKAYFLLVAPLLVLRVGVARADEAPVPMQAATPARPAAPAAPPPAKISLETAPV